MQNIMLESGDKKRKKKNQDLVFTIKEFKF